MSLTRSKYDACNQRSDERLSTNVSQYAFEPRKYYPPQPCQNPLGLVSGNDVSLPRHDNLVNLESDILGYTRINSRCPDHKYRPNNGVILNPLPLCSIVNPCQNPPCSHGLPQSAYDTKNPGCPLNYANNVGCQPR